MIHHAWNAALASLAPAALSSASAQGAAGAESAPSRDATFWFPEQASEIAQSLDNIFYFILWVSIVSFVIVIGAAAMFVLRYRAREGHREEKTSSHDTRLELTWTIIPTILVAVMFYVGAKGFFDLKQAPGDSYQVQVLGFRWAWEFVYPNGVRTNELHVPLDQPVRLVMTSSDVLHSLFIPAFRVKQDVVPGRYTSLWFKPIRTGTFHLFCTEYCGTQHAGMITRVVVHERDTTSCSRCTARSWSSCSSSPASRRRSATSCCR
jgi:cytochrome c oxidase subunit II